MPGANHLIDVDGFLALFEVSTVRIYFVSDLGSSQVHSSPQLYHWHEPSAEVHATPWACQAECSCLQVLLHFRSNRAYNYPGCVCTLSRPSQ